MYPFNLPVKYATLRWMNKNLLLLFIILFPNCLELYKLMYSKYVFVRQSLTKISWLIVRVQICSTHWEGTLSTKQLAEPMIAWEFLYTLAIIQDHCQKSRFICRDFSKKRLSDREPQTFLNTFFNLPFFLFFFFSCFQCLSFLFLFFHLKIYFSFMSLFPLVSFYFLMFHFVSFSFRIDTTALTIFNPIVIWCNQIHSWQTWQVLTCPSWLTWVQIG